MDYTDKQYERVARYLDGETIILSEEEDVLLAEMRDDEASLDEALLEAPRGGLPAELVQRARPGYSPRRRKLAWLVMTESVAATITLFIAGVLLASAVGAIPTTNPIAMLADADTPEIALFSNGLETQLSSLDEDLQAIEAELDLAIDISFVEEFDAWYDADSFDDTEY